MKKGEKYIIEIEEVIETEGNNLYRVKGFDNLVFTEENLEHMDKLSGLSKTKEVEFEKGRLTGWKQAVGYMGGVLEEMNCTEDGDECDCEIPVAIEIQVADDFFKSLFGEDEDDD